MKKNIIAVVAGIAAVSIVLAGCGASESEAFAVKESRDYYEEPIAMAEEAAGSYDNGYATDEVYDMGDSMSNPEADVADNEQIEAAMSNRKLIKTVNMNVETREFDKLIPNVLAKIKELGGYAESTNVSGNSYDYSARRSANITARIPAQNLDSFVTSVETQSNITSKNENAEDVTLQYSDVEAHKESLKIEQKRLNELLEQAEDLDTIIALESRLTQVRYEIESYESRLRTMDNQVTYSTVYLYIDEVVEYTPDPVAEKTFGQELSEQFLESCEDAWDAIKDFVIGFIAFLPRLLVILIIVGVIGGIIFGIVKGIIAIVKKTAGKGRGKERRIGKKSVKKVASEETTVIATALSEPPKKENGENDTANE